MKWTPIVAMLCIAGLEIVALTQGINGAAFGITIAALAGLGGYEMKSHLIKKEDKTKHVEEYLKKAGFTDKFIGSVIKKAKGGE